MFMSQHRNVDFTQRGGLNVDSVESLAVVVNKRRPLADKAYIPEDLHAVDGVTLRSEAAASFEVMRADADSVGIVIAAVSGYRTVVNQSAIYASYSSRYGAPTADKIAARPGFSEHQTGLAVDIASPGGSYALSPCFDATQAGSWAAAHAHRHGFIIRYPLGQELATGFAYEPWHLRFVGNELAVELYVSGQTLEAFAGLPPAPSH